MTNYAHWLWEELLFLLSQYWVNSKSSHLKCNSLVLSASWQVSGCHSYTTSEAVFLLSHFSELWDVQACEVGLDDQTPHSHFQNLMQYKWQNAKQSITYKHRIRLVKGLKMAHLHHHYSDMLPALRAISIYCYISTWLSQWKSTFHINTQLLKYIIFKPVSYLLIPCIIIRH